MDKQLSDRLTSGDLWKRFLFMVLFAIAYGVAEVVYTVVVVFQFLAILFSGQANEPMLKFGKNLSIYISQIIQFQTFNTEEHPFPFSDWPDEEPEPNRWTEEGEDEQDSDDSHQDEEQEELPEEQPDTPEPADDGSDDNSAKKKTED